MLAKAAKAEEAMDPGRVIASAVAQHGVARKVVPQPHHDGAEIDSARLLGRLLRPGEIVGMRGLGLTAQRPQIQVLEHRRECRGRRMDRQMRTVDAAKFFSARMDMHERHLRPRNVEQRVALRR